MDDPLIGDFLNACASLCMGLLILYISLITLTIPHRYSGYLRLALAPPAILFFWDFGYGPYEAPALFLVPGMATIGLYGIMRILEHSVTSFWDPAPSHWVARTRPKKGTCTALVLPYTPLERVSYALDLLTSLRGSSWFADLEWNWIPRSLRLPFPPLSRRRFLASNVRTLVFHYLLIDLCDTVNKSRTWETQSPDPVTSLPILHQLIFSISVCAGIVLSITIPYTLISSAFVLCGSSPSSWPPMFNSPFCSKSLRDFWSRRWHYIFRRVFDRLSIPLMSLSLYIFGSDARSNEHIISVTRSVITFALSALLHLIIMHRLAMRECNRSDLVGCPSFWDASILRFFLCQPVGLFMESTLVAPLADWMFPVQECSLVASRSHLTADAPVSQSTENGDVGDYSKPYTAIPANNSLGPLLWKREAVTRLYTWVFLIWTGRWWADKWVQVGLWNEEEKLVPFSIWRWLLHGRWVV